MQYTTIFTSNDRTEVSIIKHLFEEHEVDYNILGETTNDAAGIAGSGMHGMRVQVPPDQVEMARSILSQNGYLGNLNKERKGKIGNPKRRGRPVISRWILIFLAALVLIIVALLIMYFMNPDT